MLWQRLVVLWPVCFLALAAEEGREAAKASISAFIAAAAQEPAHDCRDVQAEVDKLKQRENEDHTALQIAQVAALSAMNNATAEATARRAAEARLNQLKEADQKAHEMLVAKMHQAQEADQQKLEQVQQASHETQQGLKAKLKMARENLAAVKNTSEAQALATAFKARQALEDSKDDLLKAQKALAAEKGQTEALRLALQKAKQESISLGSFGHWLQQLRQQQVVAAVAVVIGLLGVVGPTSLIDFVFAAAGSVLTGLLLASGCSYFTAAHKAMPSAGTTPLRWLDFCCGLICGKGDMAGCAVWGIWALLGITRYLSGCRCHVYRFVPYVKLSASSGEVEPVRESSLNAPLIGNNKDTARTRGFRGDPAPREDARPTPQPSARSTAPDEQPMSARQMMALRQAQAGAVPSPNSARGGSRTLPKPPQSKSTGLMSRLTKTLQGSEGSSHLDGRPGGAANHLV